MINMRQVMKEVMKWYKICLGIRYIEIYEFLFEIEYF